MSYREAREVARLRHELRERLMSDRHEGVSDLLARFQALAEEVTEVATPELAREAERWRVRFELLASTARNN